MKDNWQTSLLNKKYDPFLEHYLKLYQENPKSKVFAPLAEAYRRSGLADDAIEICKEGLEYHPKFISGLVALGRAYFDKGNFDSTILNLEKVVEEAPDNYLAQKILAEAYLKTGNKNNALKCYKMVLFLNPTDAEIAKKVENLEAIDEELTIPHIEIPPFPFDLPTFVEEKNNIHEEEFKIIDNINTSASLNFEEKKISDVFDFDHTEEDPRVITDFSTVTMGELLESQGLKDKAIEVYTKLSKTDPENNEIKLKLDSLQKNLKPEPKPKPEPEIKEGQKIENKVEETKFVKEKEPDKKIPKPSRKKSTNDDGFVDDNQWINLSKPNELLTSSKPQNKKSIRIKKLETILKQVEQYKRYQILAQK